MYLNRAFKKNSFNHSYVITKYVITEVIKQLRTRGTKKRLISFSSVARENQRGKSMYIKIMSSCFSLEEVKNTENWRILIDMVQLQLFTSLDSKFQGRTTLTTFRFEFLKFHIFFKPRVSKNKTSFNVCLLVCARNVFLQFQKHRATWKCVFNRQVRPPSRVTKRSVVKHTLTRRKTTG